MLLDSICSLLADKYRGVPIYIEDVPEGFQRPSFLVTLATEGTDLLNKNIYRDTPIYQIVYFGRLNASEQVYSERLYKVKEELKALFLLPGAIPVISEKGSRENQRYATFTSYSSEIRLSEKSLYTKMGLDFTEDTKQEKEYELIQEIDLEMNTRKN